ncbi:bifunctional serine/threonine-protein kinase/formylglycine-generating enzyme family protein [Candidatus Viridilinea mediisalina]|uniref:Protein kinase domain-containing protein n=1 Tax=Candidatus Viridilinea mediisalina TaxID=2024553 RepID=A0A2A6RJU9_9CHLR|nr:bifunctional serine/threonine-protein kinase/formylglycine-generating enzyme family protein [Candidatus Viridilinea mediisalina]PDW03347.1 hypothetical protein CJ255_09180 [Candidatus Viridilinea mediisalina]
MNQNILCPACHQLNAPQTRYCRMCSHDLILNNLGPRYFLTRLIKLRGQGAIFEGRDEAGRVYLIKELLDRFHNANERAEALARFQAEADMLRRLNHPQIPRFHAAFDDQGRYYLVMDFIKGEALAELVAREGPLPEAQVLAWATQLCAVLAYLHDQGLIYGAMRPANVLLEAASDRLNLIDFSLATVLQPNVRSSQRGTPGYAAPEQHQGLATQQSDIYALGATLHHLLSGRPPETASFSFAPLRTLVPTVSPQTEALVARALELQQAQRFQSSAELRAALVAAQATRAQTDPVPAPVAASQPIPTPAPVAPPQLPPAPTPMPKGVVWTLTISLFLLFALFLHVLSDALLDPIPRPPARPTATPAPTFTPDARPSELRTIVYTLEISFDADHELSWPQIRGRFVALFWTTVRSDYACCAPSIPETPTFLQEPELIDGPEAQRVYRATVSTLVLLRGEDIPNPDEMPVSAPLGANIMGDWLPELVHVPAGPFLMGGSTDDSVSLGIINLNEPQHTLILPDYWIGKTSVTNAQFRLFVEGDGYQNQSYWTAEGWAWREQAMIHEPASWHDERLNRDEQPVVGVSWYEAVAYVRWLSATTGHTFRLPTEPEWEKAARGPDGQIYPWGNHWDANRLNHANNNHNHIGTTSVWHFPGGASPYGALDMLGNAIEWCTSKWHQPYPYVLVPEWTEEYLAGEQHRVVRGGSWGHPQVVIYAASRFSDKPSERSRINGLRVVSDSNYP